MTTKSALWSDNLRLPCLDPAGSQELLGLLEAEAIRSNRPIPFQSKHVPSLKRNVWYALRRPIDKSRTGFLCVWPEKQSCVYISGDPPNKRFPIPRIAALDLRVDPQFYKSGFTVFEATLSPVARALLVEDVVVWKGRDVTPDTFTERWLLAKQWIEHYCIVPQGQLTLDLAPWSALTSIKPEGIWEFIEDDVRKRRLVWICRDQAEPEGGKPDGGKAEGGKAEGGKADGGKADGGKAEVPIKKVVAVATRPAAAGPDQWDLAAADGSALGRALVRTMQVSTELRTIKHNTVRLEVKWNTAFKKWEAVQITTSSASPMGDFTAASE
jgi:hypothetical protein